MYEDLEPIANLRFGKEADTLARNGEATLRGELADLAQRGLGNSGAAVQTRVRARVRRSERLCHALADIWVELIERKNVR